MRALCRSARLQPNSSGHASSVCVYVWFCMADLMPGVPMLCMFLCVCVCVCVHRQRPDRWLHP